MAAISLKRWSGCDIVGGCVNAALVGLVGNGLGLQGVCRGTIGRQAELLYVSVFRRAWAHPLQVNHHDTCISRELIPVRLTDKARACSKYDLLFQVVVSPDYLN